MLRTVSIHTFSIVELASEKRWYIKNTVWARIRIGDNNLGSVSRCWMWLAPRKWRSHNEWLVHHPWPHYIFRPSDHAEKTWTVTVAYRSSLESVGSLNGRQAPPIVQITFGKQRWAACHFELLLPSDPYLEVSSGGRLWDLTGVFQPIN